jgi:hypothetical protein
MAPKIESECYTFIRLPCHVFCTHILLPTSDSISEEGTVCKYMTFCSSPIYFSPPVHFLLVTWENRYVPIISLEQIRQIYKCLQSSSYFHDVNSQIAPFFYLNENLTSTWSVFQTRYNDNVMQWKECKCPWLM